MLVLLLEFIVFYRMNRNQWKYRIVFYERWRMLCRYRVCIMFARVEAYLNKKTKNKT